MNEIKKWTIYLPQRNGGYAEIEIPKYLDRVLFENPWDRKGLRIKDIGQYWYKIQGFEKERPAYGIEKDIELLKRFLDRFSRFSDGTSLQTITDIKFHKEKKNYYVKFKMVDPYSLAMERAGLVTLRR